MASPAAILYILKHDLEGDTTEKRAPYKDAHRAYLKKYIDNGSIVLSGPVAQPYKVHLTIFRNLSEKEVEDIAKNDPYVVNNVLTKYTVKPFFANVGDAALKNDLVQL